MIVAYRQTDKTGKWWKADKYEEKNMKIIFKNLYSYSYKWMKKYLKPNQYKWDFWDCKMIFVLQWV